MRKLNTREILPWLTNIMQIPHVYASQRDDEVPGDVLYVLAIGTRKYLVCNDDDSPTPRYVVAPLKRWDADNAIEALPDTPVLTVRAIGKQELEQYFDVPSPAPEMPSTERSSMVSLSEGRA